MNSQNKISMGNNINLWSFILSLICVPMFFITISSASFIDKFTDTTGTHPLNIVLIITLATFVLSIIGLKDLKGWKTTAISICSVLITLGLSGIIIFILIFGSLLS